MITFAPGQDKTKLFVTITPRSPLDPKLELDFCRSCASEIEQVLLREHLRMALNDMVEEIRRVSYRAGWRDAKSKQRPKLTCFASCLRILDWER